jgi:hypothetical protein
MEPLDEDELKHLLRKWEAPSAPPSLRQRVFRAPAQKSWLSWLLTGSIRIPVPAVVAVAIVIALWIHYSRSAPPSHVASPGSVSLADFQPVRQLEPVLVGGGQR